LLGVDAWESETRCRFFGQWDSQYVFLLDNSRYGTRL
jgi:hypothetical protein